MPYVRDPNSLTYLLDTPIGGVVVSADVRAAYNDLFRAWHELTFQAGPVLRKRLNRATYFRARYDDQVKL